MTLKDDLAMVDYYLDSKGLEAALTPWYMPDLVKDPVIEILLKEREVTRLALQARIVHLQNVQENGDA